MTNNEKKQKVIEYWRNNVDSCKDMNDEDILQSILNYAIDQEYGQISKYEYLSKQRAKYGNK